MNRTSASHRLLRIVLFLAGAAIVALGINVGFGGIRTLGWQDGGAEFLTVVDAAAYGIHDNHVRFLGGIWLGLGLFMMAGSVWLVRLRTLLVAFTAMILVGGLARISALDPDILFSAAIAPSFVLELVLFPLLGLWIVRTVPDAGG